MTWSYRDESVVISVNSGAVSCFLWTWQVSTAFLCTYYIIDANFHLKLYFYIMQEYSAVNMFGQTFYFGQFAAGLGDIKVIYFYWDMRLYIVFVIEYHYME